MTKPTEAQMGDALSWGIFGYLRNRLRSCEHASHLRIRYMTATLNSAAANSSFRIGDDTSGITPGGPGNHAI